MTNRNLYAWNFNNNNKKENVMNDKQKLIKLEKEVASLHGKLGANGRAVKREEKYQELERQLADAHKDIESLVLKESCLRDKIAIAAMQGIFATYKEALDLYATPEDLATDAYKMADAMIEIRNKK